MFFLKYFLTSTLYVKMAIILLFVMVIVALTMALTKFKRIRYINSYIKSFEETFWSGISLDDFYRQNSENLNHPLGMVFKAVYEEWEASEHIRTNVYNKPDIKERMLNVANVQKLKVLHTCEKYLDTLELFIKSAPFVGLFGTIIGMIDVFYNIDLQNGLNILSTASYDKALAPSPYTVSVGNITRFPLFKLSIALSSSLLLIILLIIRLAPLFYFEDNLYLHNNLL